MSRRKKRQASRYRRAKNARGLMGKKYFLNDRYRSIAFVEEPMRLYEARGPTKIKLDMELVVVFKCEATTLRTLPLLVVTRTGRG